MSRRKQPHPKHFESDSQLAEILRNGSSDCEEGDDEHICGKCRADFDGLSEFLRHKKRCTRRQLVVILPDEALLAAESSEEEEEADEMECEESPSMVKGPTKRFPEDDCPKRTLVSTSKLPHFAQFHSIPDTHVALEALQNTRVAVAQHGHTARASELGALQSALYTLQQQQLLQLQIIQQLHQHILGGNGGVPPQLTGTAALTPPQSTDGSSGNAPPPLVTTTTAPNRLDLQSQVIQNHPPPPPPPPPQEPNTLELLQRHTEQALQNTMAGGSFLLNGINHFGDGQYLKKKSGDGSGDDKAGEDGLFRHRCRFCGKVFGSDSALQIHVRSHTGERPFKCNVCGNRFTTKGNLKVHFQRHKTKYPHIRMNSEPVPEHLDSLHPPLEPPTSNGASSPALSTTAAPLDPMDTGATSMAQDLSIRTGGGRETPPMRSSYSPNEGSNLTVATDCSDDGSDLDPMEHESDVLKHEEMGERDSSPEPRSPEKRDDIEDEGLADEEELAKHDEEVGKRPQSSESFVGFSKLSSFTSYLGNSTPNFPSFFHPSTFSAISPFTFATATPTTTIAPSTCYPGHQPCSTSLTDAGGSTITADPAFYQDLLPKPGSTDNTWESLMEVTKPSETSKLQQLVDNIENKLSDPNQCIICHRVLSCKSALQMHYRTHTGERPFKCKICGRAFTTKGNLKTHMGVHRVKPPLRVLHQCPVCHKQFTNSLVLQQHIRMHTGEPVDMLPEHILANEIKMAPMPMLPASFQRPPPMLALMPPTDRESLRESMRESIRESPMPADDSMSGDEKVTKEDEERPVSPAENSCSPPALTSPAPKIDSPPPPPPVTSDTSPSPTIPVVTTAESPIPHSAPSPLTSIPVSYPPSSTIFSTSLAALENHVKTINTCVPQPLPFGPFGIALPMGGPYPRYDDPMSYFSRSHHPLELSVSRGGDKSPSSQYSSSLATSRAASEGSADERSTPGGKGDSPLSIITSKSDGALDLTPRASVLSGGPAMSMSRSQSPSQLSPGCFPMLKGLPFPPSACRTTTCQICFKTFACNSALEIHYRSHTKERPFKCNFCDRGFSTRGNMKQHMLTHKIRDLPSDLFTTTTEPMERERERRPESQASAVIVPPAEPVKSEAAATGESPKVAVVENSVSSGSSGSTPIKRPPGMPKHMCFICNKPFSSASALQIHNRTHTGDKPFKCTICGRAFTTKGNLKVHMGTHMWNNGSSRRGRRMSLDLPPLPVPPPGKPGDLMQHHRTDLYFQYLSPSFMNGMTPPKMNEISVIQTASGITNGVIYPPHMRNPMMHNPSPPKNGDYRPSSDESPNEKKTPSPIGSAGDHGSQRSPELRAPMAPTWAWKIACNVCNKICSSSTDLEVHLKSHHYKKESKEIADPPVAENLAA